MPDTASRQARPADLLFTAVFTRATNGGDSDEQLAEDRSGGRLRAVALSHVELASEAGADSCPERKMSIEPNWHRRGRVSGFDCAGLKAAGASVDQTSAHAREPTRSVGNNREQ